ncbi:hypothetical protein [Chamaesiphon sp. VAR_48_metabat_403]|nr:hypothetical protein [Chamaesiphon sp. VAR_48_metabat_403]
MLRNYRYQFPIRIILFKYGITIAWKQPIVKISDGSISVFLGMFDDD